MITDLATNGSRSIPGRTSSSSCTIGTAIATIHPPAPFDRKFDSELQRRENGRAIMQRAKRDDHSADLAMDLAHMEALYDGGIAFTDEQIGKVLQLLQDLGISGKTLVIVLSDHGEAFLEHGMISTATASTKRCFTCR